ncbi:hypothetical protein BN903_186 [Halorubrum sp. AJ67]|nr:hypothetical protein BN903_186 [Halorubrum sp. AJ67]
MSTPLAEAVPSTPSSSFSRLEQPASPLIPPTAAPAFMKSRRRTPGSSESNPSVEPVVWLPDSASVDRCVSFDIGESASGDSLATGGRCGLRYKSRQAAPCAVGSARTRSAIGIGVSRT